MKLLTWLALTIYTGFAFGFDQSKKIGFGGQFGYGAAFIDNDYQDSGLRDGDLMWGGYGRYHFNSSFGIDLGYSRYEIKETTVAAEVYDLISFYRFQGAEDFSIIAGLGLGAANLTNNSPSNFKIRT